MKTNAPVQLEYKRRDVKPNHTRSRFGLIT